MRIRKMQKILLYEFTCSGGLWSLGDEVTSADPLTREGQAMLAAMAADFAALDGVQPIVLRDRRWDDWSLGGCQVCEVDSAAEEQSQLKALASQAAGVVFIYPEFDGLLLERCRWVENACGNLLGPSSKIVELASDKQRTADHLAAAKIPATQGQSLFCGQPLPENFPYPAVVKPRDGCGSQDVQLLRTPSVYDDFARRPRAELRIERFVPGVPASVAVLCGPKELQPLVPCRQRLSNDGRFHYLGGDLPLRVDLANRAQDLAVRAIAALPEPRGYIGVDLVLGDDPAGSGDAVIEINPRLTTSYIGLRAAATGNLANAMWAIAEGRAAEVSFGDARIEFDSDGTVRKCQPNAQAIEH
jgi:predicted ATP-grasp superfamily ATP-dependent carboligase